MTNDTKGPTSVPQSLTGRTRMTKMSVASLSLKMTAPEPILSIKSPQVTRKHAGIKACKLNCCSIIENQFQDWISLPRKLGHVDL